MMDDGVAVCELVRDELGRSTDYLVLEVNHSFESHTGLPPSDVVGRKRSEFISIHNEHFLEVAAQMIDSHRPVRLEHYNEGLDRWFSIGMFPLGGDRFVQLFHDITERKRAEEALRRSEVRYRGLFENLHEMVVLRRFIYNDKGEIIDRVVSDANPAALKAMGIGGIDEILGKGDRELYRSELSTDQLEVANRMRKTGKPITEEVHFYATDRDYLATYSLLDKDHLITMSVDITELKKAERALQEGKDRLQFILDSLPVGVSVTDANGRVLIRNKILGGFLSYDLPPSKNTTEFGRFIGYRPGTDIQLEVEDWPISQTLAKGEAVNGMEIDMMGLDGNRRTMIVFTELMRKENGAPNGVIAALVDITIQKEAEKNLSRSNYELQQFAYLSSHDLQEPLRMVVSYMSLLEKRYKDQLDPKAREYIDNAIEGGSRMRQLIDDLLAYSRLETTGKKFVPVNMNEVLESTIKVLMVTIEENRADISVGPLPTVKADGSQMVQLMQNLVGNAIKFHGSERPMVQIKAKPGHRDWTFSVKDNGIGMNTEYSEKIFQMFQRLHNQDQYPGTGVGLAIAKKIVERHGGRIWVESEEGKGATFFFTIPKK
jgi:PAS domain S-box-containing protein